MNLAALKDGESGVIIRVRGRGAFRKRIIEMGFVRGKKIIVVKNAPLKDPIEYRVMGYSVSLRRSEADMIEVMTPEEAAKQISAINGHAITEDVLINTVKKAGKSIHVVLVGNPNSGKTSIFNLLSHSNEKVGNYSGVTIESKEAGFNHKGFDFRITDLPGTYSLTAYTPEEIYVREYLLNNSPDVVINVVDGSNLERNLYLTTQLIDMDQRIVVALNMYDELTGNGDALDFNTLGKLLGTPFVPTIGRKGDGLKELLDRVINVYTDKDKTSRHIHIQYGEEMELSIKTIQKVIRVPNNELVTNIYSSRYLAIKLMEKDKQVEKLLDKATSYKGVLSVANNEILRLEKLYGEDAESLVTDAKYGFIAGALKETFRKSSLGNAVRSDHIDSILTHQLWGIPVFLGFLWLMFQSTFTLGKFPMMGIQYGISYLGEMVRIHLADGPLKDLLIQGIIAGVGGVIVFLPNILILFLFISVMEDTGYMARAAFIMDKLMHKIGLHGRSFIPLIMGFGCNVPAIMATRTIENRQDRILTMLINPFMSCSARLPIYILLIGAFFPHHPGSMLFFLYSTGILTAIVMAVLFKKTIFRSEGLPFVMELPPYRLPTLRATVRHMWNRTSQYLQKMGGIILVASILIWAMGYYPKPKAYSKDYVLMIATVNKSYDSSRINLRQTNNAVNMAALEIQKKAALHSIEASKKGEEQEYSVIGHIGKIIEPIMRPLGFDWRMSISILSGVAAKEIVVSTLGVLYHADPDSKNGDSLASRLKEQTYTTGPKAGKKVFNIFTALSFMIFTLLYFPCIASIAAIQNETGSWKWALFAMFYTTATAWIMSFSIYHISLLLA
jgi:ferrous iron transport protein B